jgi:hypothetical protein
MIERKHTGVLAQLVPLKGQRVVDVGCGEGGLCRFLARQGASVIGVEAGPAALARARAVSSAGRETYLEGAGETLPLGDASADAVIYLNSFHHVPVALQDRAIAEAARVLAPGGMLCILEPLPEGSYFELARPVEDETEIRARASEAIGRAPACGFTQEVEMLYGAPFRFEDFAAFKRTFVAVDPRRQGPFEAQEAPMRDAFHRLAERRADGHYYFIQPTRFSLLRKASPESVA